MTDTFRKEYKPLDEEQKAVMKDIKERASDLHDFIDNYAAQLPAGDIQRSFAVAKTKLQEAVMWAIHGVTGVEAKAPEEAAAGDTIPDRNTVG